MVRITAIVLLLIAFLSCTRVHDGTGLHFTLLEPTRTGITFANTLTTQDFLNGYACMGGGVGVGDFNRDGLPDLFFAGNEVSSRLYLNHGDFIFEDITQRSGVYTDVWCTGVSVVDINNDGWPDIYVCVAGRNGAKQKNLLFINQHDLTFKEDAAGYGLAAAGWSTQAVFFDYDHDGRLDMYLVNHAGNETNDLPDQALDTNAIAADQLFHNQGTPPGKAHPVFKDISRQAGIIENGDGLGVAIGDFNNDGYPDIYVNNSDIRNDLLWQNNKDGTFTNIIASAIRHQSYFSSGADAADINNDGLADIITLDKQTSLLSDQLHQALLDRGYEPQYGHNMLQLNNGVRPPGYRSAPVDIDRPGVGPLTPFFSEIAAMAGIARTGHSWSALIADFDNDGWKDIHITTGIPNDPGHNYLYRNKGNLLFEDVSERAGIVETGISSGAVYADLDNSGHLDLISNNSDGPAYVRRNDSKPNNYLTIRLIGDSNNTDGIGATIYAYTRGKMQTITQYPVRGYLSSVDNRPHFGSGPDAVDSIKVVWPDGREQTIPHPPMNTTMTIDYRTSHPDPPAANLAAVPLFMDAAQKLKIAFRHKETFFFDYQFQPAILQKYSQEGPFISTGDLNGDGLEDFFIGGAFKQSGKLFYQNKDGTFTGRDLVTGNKYEEDMQSVIFDANGDQHPDLLVLGGSSEFDDHSSFYCPRLYLNDGHGNLRLDSTAFAPDIRTPAKCVAVADIDGDGQEDVFIGGRVSLDAYPRSAPSYILHNEHGHFVDVTARVCPALKNAGMLNAARFTDLDGDGKPDLVLAGDGLPIRLFHNDGKTLQEITVSAGLDGLPGCWRSLLITDINNDGYPDIVAGNLGLNNPFGAGGSYGGTHSDSQPPAPYPVAPQPADLPASKDGAPIHDAASHDAPIRDAPSHGAPIRDAAGHGAPIRDAPIHDAAGHDAPIHDAREVREMRSGYFENDGHGHFSFHPFPLMAQLAPVNAMVCTDVDGDGYPDLILAGNEYQAAVRTGRYDASYGLLLKADGYGGFRPIAPTVDGLILDGDVKDLRLIVVGGHPFLLTAINDQPLRALQLSGSPLRQ